MEARKILSGKLRTEKMQVAATVSNRGIPMLIPAANGAGLAQATTTGAADMVGINLDTVTYVTAQQTDGTSAERIVEVITNPDLVMAALLSGGATEDTALTQYDITTATTDGLDVTTGDDWSSPEFDEGAVWGYDGANAGQVRKITSTSTTAATPTVAFDNNHQVGDNFLRAPYWPGQSTTVQLSTNLYQADASIAVGTGAAFRCYALEARDKANEGTTNSYILMLSDDHAFSGRP